MEQEDHQSLLPAGQRPRGRKGSSVKSLGSRIGLSIYGDEFALHDFEDDLEEQSPAVAPMPYQQYVY